MSEPYDAFAAFFLQVPIDIYGVFQSTLPQGLHQGHKAKPTTKSGILIAAKRILSMRAAAAMPCGRA